jgi:hypothetical protein
MLKLGDVRKSVQRCRALDSRVELLKVLVGQWMNHIVDEGFKLLVEQDQLKNVNSWKRLRDEKRVLELLDELLHQTILFIIFCSCEIYLIWEILEQVDSNLWDKEWLANIDHLV